MMNYDKEFYDVIGNLEANFDSHLLFVAAPDNTVKAAINLADDTLIALVVLLRAKSAINKQIDLLVNSEEIVELSGEDYVEENED